MTPINIDLPYAKYAGDFRTKHLLDLVLEAHRILGMNDNCLSTGAFINCYKATGSMPSAIASAVLTLNGLHAPIQQARDVYEYYDEEMINRDILEGRKIAGFGNAFHKDSIDPVWLSVQQYMISEFFQEYRRLMDLQDWVNYIRRKYKPDAKDIFINPAMWTAVVCGMYNFDRGSELSLFIMARLPTWIEKGVCNA